MFRLGAYFATYFAFVWGIAAVSLVGWVANVVAVFTTASFTPITGWIIVQVAGIFVAPLGVFTGWYWLLFL